MHGGGSDRGSFFCGSGGDEDYPGAEVATLKAEEELWEARQASERTAGGGRSRGRSRGGSRPMNKKYCLPRHSFGLVYT